MIILAIDTTTDYLSVAVRRGATPLSEYHRPAATNHSRLLIPTIDRVLKDSRLSLRDLDVLAVSIGPGSFTGLRIGVTTVKALGFCLKLPIVAVPTLDVIAQNAGVILAHERGAAKLRRITACPLLDAKKGKVYACIYTFDAAGRVKRVSDYLLLPIGDVLKGIRGDCLFFGSGVAVYRHAIEKAHPCSHIYEGNDWRPRASVVAELAAERARKNQVTSIDPFDGAQDPAFRPGKKGAAQGQSRASSGLKAGARRGIDDIAPLYLYSRECDITGK